MGRVTSGKSTPSSREKVEGPRRRVRSTFVRVPRLRCATLGMKGRRSPVLAIEACYFAFRLAIGSPLLQISALVMGHLSLGDADLRFQLSIFPIQAEHHESAAGDRAETVE